MPFSSSVTRRQAIVGAAATMASARLFGMQALPTVAKANSQKNKSSLKTLLHVTHPTSKNFDTMLNDHFPGLASLPSFESIRPLLLIVRNKTETRVSALNATWTLNSPTGRVSRHSYAYFFRPSRIKKASQSGQFSVIGSKKLCIVSPFFCWTSKRFEKAAGPATLTALLQKYPIRNQFALDAASAQSLKGRLDAAINVKGHFVGSRKSGLADRYVGTRNAEHDEALLLLTDRESAAGKSLEAALVQHKNTPPAPHASPQERIYHDARMRFAGLIQIALRHTDEGSVQTILEGVKNTPQTVLSRRSV
jgi:hypothetical protein